MYRVINKYIENTNLRTGEDIYNRLTDYLKTVSDIKQYTISVHSNHYVVNIRLACFSVEQAATIFHMFNAKVSYPYSSLYVRFNEGKCVRYRYVTSKENKDGFYCDIIFG